MERAGDVEAGMAGSQESSPMNGGAGYLGSSGSLLQAYCPRPSLFSTLCTRCHKVTIELWRRIKLEVIVELPMLRQRWMIIVFGIVMQYVHGIFTQLAHRMHQPQEEPLHDVGFELTPELGPDKFWVSEAIFGTLFAMFVVWTFTPFLLQRKRFYTAVMWSRLLMVLVVCQVLRIITFSVTQLPGPSFHCRASEATAVRPWPKHWTGHMVVDVQRAASKSCGDLVFSSHTTFVLTGILAFNEYGSWPLMKAIAWAAGAIMSTLIVASRKHYTVDIVIAWYTVPLVFYTLHRRWTTRRPMSEFLGAIGENDEPDPGSPDGLLDANGGGHAEQVSLMSDKVVVDVKSLLSHPKERSVSTVKLTSLLGGGGSGGNGNNGADSQEQDQNSGGIMLQAWQGNGGGLMANQHVPNGNHNHGR